MAWNSGLVKRLAAHVADHNQVHAWANTLQAGATLVASGGSIQTAYDALPSTGGIIMLEPYGRYDVGAGLVLTRTKEAAFVTAGRANRLYDNGVAPTIYSSTGAATLVTFPNPVSVANAYGFEFRNIDFEISTTTTLVFDATSVNMMIVEYCGAYHPDADAVKAEFLFINANHTDTGLGDDSSWFRVSNNYVRGGTLVYAVGPNANQWVIRENIVFPINSTNPMIYLESAHRCVIRDNNLEGTAPSAGIHLKAVSGSRLDGNAGEGTDPFIIVDGSYGNLITDMGISNATTAVFVSLVNNSTDNLIIAAVGTPQANLYQAATWITDSTTNQNNWIIAPSTFGTVERLKISGIRRGAGSPEGAELGDPGELYTDKTNGTAYVKTSGFGNTGWSQLAVV